MYARLVLPLSSTRVGVSSAWAISISGTSSRRRRESGAVSPATRWKWWMSVEGAMCSPERRNCVASRVSGIESQHFDTTTFARNPGP